MTIKIRKIWKAALIFLLVFLLYELIGIAAAYHRQPDISDAVKNAPAADTEFYSSSDCLERAAIIEDNRDGLTQRLRLIEHAEEQLILSTFSFRSDESGKIVIGALLHAADRGVQIQILVDGFDGFLSMQRNSYFYALSSHENIVIKLYNPINLLTPWKLMGRLHDKYLIADGTVYIMGGRNTSNLFLGDYPGAQNHDRDVLVYCEEKVPTEGSSVLRLQDYFAAVWDSRDSRLFHEQPALKKRTSVQKASADADRLFAAYRKEHLESIADSDYISDTFETDHISLLTNPIHTAAKEPLLWYQLTRLMETAEDQVRVHTPYIIFNDMMYDSWEQVAKAVPNFTVMTNSAANNANLFGAADYMKYKEKILRTGAEVWEYESGDSYHGKSILIDEDISVVGSFNMDMRSAYLDTEMMLVIKSKEINRQLSDYMQRYEQQSRQALPGGEYYNPHLVVPVEMSGWKKAAVFLIQRLLGWARFLL